MPYKGFQGDPVCLMQMRFRGWLIRLHVLWIRKLIHSRPWLSATSSSFSPSQNSPSDLLSDSVPGQWGMAMCLMLDISEVSSTEAGMTVSCLVTGGISWSLHRGWGLGHCVPCGVTNDHHCCHQWIHECVRRWMSERMKVCKWSNQYKSGLIYEWVTGWTNKKANARIDKWKNERVGFHESGLVPGGSETIQESLRDHVLLCQVL